MSKATTKVFVYGTLKEGRPLDRRAFAERRTSVEEATIVGSIFNLGHFPTIKLDGRGVVHGEVHTFKSDDFPMVLRSMDAIEGYNAQKPEAGLYTRHLLDVTTESGEVVKAWAYEYNGSVGDERRLEDGVWEPHK